MMGAGLPIFVKEKYMKYKVLYEDKIFDEIEDVLEFCIDDEYHWDDDYFEEWVNDNWGSIDINGYDYYAYDILDRAGDLDSVREDYCENLNENDYDEARYALRRANVGDTIDIQAYEVEVIDDGEEEEEEEADNKIDQVRTYLEEQKILEDSAAEAAKQKEDDLMKLFQVITND